MLYFYGCCKRQGSVHVLDRQGVAALTKQLIYTSYSSVSRLITTVVQLSIHSVNIVIRIICIRNKTITQTLCVYQHLAINIMHEAGQKTQKRSCDKITRRSQETIIVVNIISCNVETIDVSTSAALPGN